MKHDHFVSHIKYNKRSTVPVHKAGKQWTTHVRAKSGLRNDRKKRKPTCQPRDLILIRHNQSRKVEIPNIQTTIHASRRISFRLQLGQSQNHRINIFPTISVRNIVFFLRSNEPLASYGSVGCRNACRSSCNVSVIVGLRAMCQLL